MTTDAFTGPELVAWMTENGWSVSAFVTASGTSRRTVYNWREKGCPYLLSLGIRALGTRVQI